MLPQILNHPLPSPPYMQDSVMNHINQLAQHQQQMPHMSHGGRTHRHKMILAHFNKGELHELDAAQGQRRHDTSNGVRKYDKLEQLLENPHLMKKIAHHVREHHHHAFGGQPMGHHIEQMRHDGRMGDSEVAMIGPNTKHLLDHYAGGGSTNPQDGHPEYFLASLLGGLGSAILPGLQKGLGGFVNGLTHWDSSKGFGENLKNSALGGLKSAFSSTDEQGNQSLPSVGDVAQSAARGFGGMMDARNQGHGWGDSVMRGARAGMEGYNSPVARFGQRMLDSRMGGQDWGNAAMQGGENALQGMQNPALRGAHSMLQARNQGQNWQNAGMRGGMEAMRGVDNPMFRAARGVMGGRLSGQNWQQAAGRGMQAATKGMNSNALVQGMRGMGQGLQRGQGFGRAAMNGAQQGMAGMGNQMQQRRGPPMNIPQEENYFNELPFHGEEDYGS